ncbi:ATP synthase subunits region ORF 7-like [Mytilus trossulus]|uniref:ATP synthase subunits region ORF 7-like n=1 Tax=Mytilus trossulus TaxID=6551 RepID=UPI0030064DAA
MNGKISSALQRISIIEQKVSKTRKICQSGNFGQQLHIPGNSFPASAYIRFYPAFEHTPAIVYGLYLYDTSRLANSRFSTRVNNLSTYGFNISITSWADTKMYGARISWMACLKNV